MGMSASQVRFLSLQHRKHNIGTQLTALSNKKMGLARDMNRISKHYTEALNQNVLRWSNDSGVSYHGLTYDLMMSPNELNAEMPYIVTDRKTGKVVLNNDVIKGMDGNPLTNASGGTLTYVDIAKMISTFSRVDDDSKLYFERTSSVHSTSGVVTDGDKAVDGAYFIPENSKTFSFDANLRYHIFEQMGLITPVQKQEMKNIAIELYGSEEAQETGVYPVGSAWGDYYIALANLHAYESFLDTEQVLCNGNTYNNTRSDGGAHDGTAFDFIYANGSFKFNTHVDGVSGANTIVQENIDGQDLDHIDFSKAVHFNSSTGEYSVDGATGSDYSKFNGGATGNVTGDVTNIRFSNQISSSGMTHNYSIDNILANGESNCADDWVLSASAWDSDCWSQSEAGSLRALLAGTASGGLHSVNDKQMLILSATDDCEYHTGETQTRLQEVIKTISNIVEANKVTTADTDALSKARTATYDYFNGYYRTEWWGAFRHETKPYDDGLIQENDNKNGYGSYKKGYMWLPFYEWDHESVSGVDAQALYNTFMSFYSYYLDHPSGSASGIGATGVRISINGSGSQSSHGYHNGVQGAVVNVASGTDSSGHSVTQISRQDYSTSGSGSVMYFNSSSTSFNIQGNEDDAVNISTSMNPLTTNLPMHQGNSCDFRYFTDGSFVSYGSDNIYGIYKDTTGTYYIKDASYCNTLAGLMQSANTITIDGSKCLSVSAGSSGIDINMLTSDTYDAYLKESMKQSHYDLRQSAKVNDDTDYHQKLIDAVDDAKQRIDDLQSRLDNFFAGADKKVMDFYDALFMKIAESGWMVDDRTSRTTNHDHCNEYLNNKFQNNDFFVTECLEKTDTTGYNYTSKQATSVLKIYTVRDENAENDALAVYESEKNIISAKEKKIDARMAKLETEQEAISTELQSVKKIITDNIDKTFKIFA